MKKVAIIISLLFMYSCDESLEPTLITEDRTFLNFESTALNLAVPIDSSASIDIVLQASTLSSTDRSFSISVDSGSTANPSTYTIPTSILIPANTYEGKITIEGTDNNLIEPEAKTLIFSITNLDNNTDTDFTTVNVSIFEVCPIPNNYFIGNYLITQTSAGLPGNGPTLSDGSVVEVYSTTNTQRGFMTEAFPNFCGGNFFQFEVNLVCNELVVPLGETTCSCGGNFTDFFGPATTNSTYDLNNDSILDVTFSDDVQSACAAPIQTTYRFTKQ